MVKRIIPLILASSIVFSCIAPVSAAETPTAGEVVNSIVQETLGSSMFNFAVIGISTGIGTYFGQPQAGAFLGGVFADGVQKYADYLAAGYTDQDIYDQFTNYNADLETEYGTTTFAPNGIYYPIALDYMTNGTKQPAWENKQWTGSFSGNAFSAQGLFGGSYSNLTIYRTSILTAPISGYYTFKLFTTSTNNVLNGKTIGFPAVSRTYYSVGAEIIGQGSLSDTGIIYGKSVQFYNTGNQSTGTFSGSIWYFIEPNDYAFETRLPTSSRPASLVTPIAIQNPDQTYTVYNNITLVDEGNKVVFDPTTGESITFTDWVYDYESRTYDLTLDGGGSMTVQFGNDSITMTQGDTVTNIFYVQDPADDPGTDDPDNPGTDADVSGFFTWWKNAWNGFVDRLFTVLDGGDLEVILPGEEGNPEDEEDDGWTVFDLFALIRDALWKIITGVITVVLDGFLGLVDAIASLGDFFDIYDPANPDGIFGVPGGGVELWS